jgi:hypothetical protein
MSDNLKVTCPHCQSTLTIDPEAGVVASHEPPAQARDKIAFEDRLQQIEDDKRRASDKMAEAMRREKSKGRLFEERFRSLLDKAKDEDDGTPPVRDIDLD